MMERDPRVRTLIESGRADRPTNADRARMRYAVLHALARGASARGTRGGGARSGTVGTATKLIAVAFVLSAAASAPFLLSEASRPSRVVHPTAQSIAPARSAPSVSPVATSPAEPAAGLLVQPEPAFPPPTPPPPRNAARGAPASVSAQTNTPAGSLAEEAALLGRALTALKTDRPEAALGHLKTHEDRYPTGVLQPERLAARVMAFCALGRRDEAHADRERFLHRWPSSPIAARVRAACAAR